MTKWNSDEVKNINQQFEKSFLLRYLVHVLGDVHQPLHASSLFSDRFPKGDEGGNLFKIQYTENINQLHKLFDSGVDKLGGDIKRVIIFLLLILLFKNIYFLFY